MTDELFFSAVKEISNGAMPVDALIQVTEGLAATHKVDLAIQLYKLWIAFHPSDPRLFAIHFNASVLQSAVGDVVGAHASLVQAIILNPDFAPAYINLGGLLERAGASDQAVLTWTRLVDRLAPITGSAIGYKLEALKQIGRVWEDNQCPDTAEAVLRQSLEIDPRQRDVAQHFISLRMAQCRWPIVEPCGSVSRPELMRGIGPLSMAAYTHDPVFQMAAAWAYAKTAIGFPAPLFEHPIPEAAEAVRRLRIGYVSSDLRNHAVGFLMPEVFERHDRGRVEIFVYYCGIPNNDTQCLRIRNAVEHWSDISDLAPATAARKIADDRIDILVDINGYTREARTALFALRPAPISVNWLGYPGTMATPYHHYLIADDWIIPEDHEVFYTETVRRLPCYQPNDRRRTVATEVPSRRDVQLPVEGVVFCCFNGLHKITRPMFEVWMTILDRVPGSVLWLLDGAEAAVEALRAGAERSGIARSRLIFAPKKANPDHLARYPLADLFLDTSPYGAHTMASDALWMGVPVLTLSGSSFSSRVCGSLLRAAGLADLVCATPDEYGERAVTLAKTPEALRHYRDHLRTHRDTCRLFDMDALVAGLEELYQRMWDEFRSGRLPQPDLRNLDVYYDIGLELDHEDAPFLTAADHVARYRSKLAEHHRRHPIAPDNRLWTEAVMAAARSGRGVRAP